MARKRHIEVSRPVSLRKTFSLKGLKKTKLKRTIGRLSIILLAFFALTIIWFSKDLPTPGRIAQKINIPSSQILDRNGKLLYAVSGDKKRLIVPLSEIPDSVKQATIALEDQHFYEHFGVDFRGIARSILANIASGEKSQGGSTITQQFVKNALLTSKKTFTRKAKEAILAIELEAIYSKDKILELYLNEIPYGSTSYGIEAASRSYFGKPAKELSLAESATLAALPQAPTYYSPYGPNREALMSRKNLALDRMVKLEYITKDQAETAKKEEIKFISRKDSITSPHFVFYVQQLVADKYGESVLQNGGLKITTSLDLKTQQQAEDAIEEGSQKLDRYKANNAALVAVDPKTGQVLAMVGSRDYFNSDIQGQVNVTISDRQPGSSFKPIVYATGFKEKFNPAYPLFDLSTDFGGNYKPNNYDGRTHGPVSIRTALSNSLNIPAVKMLSLVGLNNAIKTAEDLGISTLNEPEKYGLSLVLGSGEVKPLEMAGAFGTFGNGGKFNKPNPILKIEDRDGKILEEYKQPTNKPAIDAQAAYLVTDVLADTQARRMVFGFTNALTIPGRQAAVKTGTTQSNRDAWTVGYTPQISTAVWVGNTDNKAMSKGADGSIVAAPIWNSFMTKYLQDKPKEDFQQPEGVKRLTVDFLSNKLPGSDSPTDERPNDLFASWHIPTEYDDIHVKVRINKINGKAATDQTPAELIEEKYCANIKSERPDNPNWEGPVRAWANSHGLSCSAPKEKDDSYSSLDQRPVVEITSPRDGANVNGSFTISADAAAHYGVREVIFYVDGQEIGKSSSAPYSISYDGTSLSSGAHTVSASVMDNNGMKTSSSPVTIEVGEAPKDESEAEEEEKETDSSGPVITNNSVSADRNSATISWSTNEPADGLVEYGLTQAMGFTSSKETSSKTSQTITISNLVPKTTYYFRIVSSDPTGNTTKSPVGSFQTR